MCIIFVLRIKDTKKKEYKNEKKKTVKQRNEKKM